MTVVDLVAALVEEAPAVGPPCWRVVAVVWCLVAVLRADG